MTRKWPAPGEGGEGGEGGGTCVKFCWVCAAGYSVANYRPHLSHFWANVIVISRTEFNAN